MCGNLALIMFVAYTPVVLLSLYSYSFNPLIAQSFATIIAACWFLLVFATTIAVISYRKRLLFEKQILNNNDQVHEQKVMSTYAHKTIRIMIVVCFLSVVVMFLSATVRTWVY